MTRRTICRGVALLVSGVTFLVIAVTGMGAASASAPTCSPCDDGSKSDYQVYSDGGSFYRG
jgi:hypothetical protein